MNVLPQLDAWLDEPIAAQNRDPECIVDLSTCLDRIAFLFSKNGMRLTVSGWGSHQSDPRLPAGEIGLTQEEALQLIYIEGILTGFVRASGNDPLVAPHFFNRVETAVRGFYAQRGLPVPWDDPTSSSPASEPQ